MAFYECVLIARQDITSAQVEALVDQFTEILKQNGGDVASREFWGLRNLAYRIKKNRKGHYVLLNVEAPAAAVQEMERAMRLSEDVLRYLTVAVEKLDLSPSAMMQSKGRDDRGGRRGGRDDRGGGRDDRGGGRDDRGGGREDRNPRRGPDAGESTDKPATAQAAET